MAYRDLMRVATVRSTAAVALALALCSGLVLATLSACAAEPGPTPTTSKATDAPVFASDEEALAAAEKAYAAYLAVSDDVARSGGEDPHRLDSVSGGKELTVALASAAKFAAAKAHLVGATEYSLHKLQSNTGSVVVFYVCDDVSATDVVNEDGVSLVGPDRTEILPFSVTVEQAANSSHPVVIEKSLWAGDNYCDQ
jgi:hypothetical protein